MALKPNLLLLQVLTKNRNNIRDGVARIQDIVTDYFKSGGKDLEVNDRAIIEDFFVKEAPSNVESIDMARDLVKLDKNPQTPYSMANDLGKRNPGLNFTDDMTFGQVNEMKQGIGSLPKGGLTETIARDDMASFITDMRGQGISNPDIAGIRRVPGDEQKRTAELVVNQNRMGADTPLKQEVMAELTELKNTKGPRFFQEEAMGFDNKSRMINEVQTTINNTIIDDLQDNLGIPEEKVDEIWRYISQIRKENPTSPRKLIATIKQELELEGINYDMRFWDNYVDEIYEITSSPSPMFRHGGLV